VPNSTGDRPTLSLIVALYFEQECVEEFVHRVRAALDSSGLSYEVLFVDDGSHDQTVPLVESMAASDPRIKLLVLSRNHGKEGAVTAGIHHARGDYLLMMDPDLQDPPERIMDFYRAIREWDCDLVWGVRKEHAAGWSTRLLSRCFWRVLNGLTGLEIPDDLAVMRIFNRAFAEEFKRYGERVRFIEGIFMTIGMRQRTLPVEHHPRFAGRSKFDFRRRIRLASNAVLAFSDRPLRLSISIGLLMLAGTLVYGLYAFARRAFWGIGLTGWTSMVLFILFIGSIQVILLGIIGNYIGRIYTETKGRPTFSVLRRVNLP
jgi:glycosyltransferase involved in cell wall biosynthesis